MNNQITTATTGLLYGKNLRLSLKAQGLKGKARREAYYAEVRKQRDALVVMDRHTVEQGWMTELGSTRFNKKGELIAYSTRHFAPKSSKTAAADRIKELEARIKELEGVKA
jgi:hypothetical protein